MDIALRDCSGCGRQRTIRDAGYFGWDRYDVGESMKNELCAFDKRALGEVDLLAEFFTARALQLPPESPARPQIEAALALYHGLGAEQAPQTGRVVRLHAH